MTGPVQNPELHNALEAWVRAAVPALKVHPWFNRLTSSQWLLRAELTLPESTVGGLEESRALFEVVARIKEFELGTPGDVPLEENGNFSDFFAMQTIAEFLEYYLRESLPSGFDHDTFELLYAELEDYLYRFDAVSMTTTIELWNVESRRPQLQLSPGVAIRPLTEEERRQSKESSISSARFGLGVEDPPSPQVLIEIERRGKDIERSSGSKQSALEVESLTQALFIGDQVLTTLRLAREGVIWLGIRRAFSDNRFMDPVREHDMADNSIWMEQFGHSFWFDAEPIPKAAPYEISEGVADRVVALWPVISSPVSKELQLPLRRFQLSFNRNNPTDRFIDQWIALEALFSDRGSDVIYKMSQRLAQFIGKDGPDRWDIFEKARKSYERRSDLVHGRVFTHKDLDTHARITEDFLRRALTKCLEAQQAPNKKDLERQLLWRDSSTSGA